ncbi:MAG TPA: hypothetical protein VKJ65_12820, partial [Phycisphaerae bacterium]|nr:hypothetical protein [Phycisphaerae bacterium]
MIKKRPWKLSEYTRQLLTIVDQYVKETGNKNSDMKAVAAWGYERNLIRPAVRDLISQLAHDLARARARDCIADENGEPVRMRHAYVETRGDKQYRFWFRMEDGTPEKMRLSAMSRRNGSLMDVMQIVRDVNYFNKNHNPGDPIQLDFNYNKDI